MIGRFSKNAGPEMDRFAVKRPIHNVEMGAFIFIHGPAASGKLTVGRELQRLTGYGLFHNHLVVDALLAVFPFGSEPFVRLREQIWLDVFSEASDRGIPLIFTFTPEPTVTPEFPSRAEEIARSHGADVHFVRLTCPYEELERRIENPSRAEFRKLRSLETFRAIRGENKDKPVPTPRSDLVIDTADSMPVESERQIVKRFSLSECIEQ